MTLASIKSILAVLRRQWTKWTKRTSPVKHNSLRRAIKQASNAAKARNLPKPRHEHETTSSTKLRRMILIMTPLWQQEIYGATFRGKNR